MGGRSLTKAEYSVLIFSAAFIVVYPLLVSLAYPLYVSGQVNYLGASEIPQEFSAAELTAFCDYVTFTAWNQSFTTVKLEVGDKEIELWVNTWKDQHCLSVSRRDVEWWGLWSSFHDYDFYAGNTKISEDYIGYPVLNIAYVDQYWSEKEKCAHFTLREKSSILNIYLTYDRARFDTAISAWNNGALHILITAGVEAMVTGQNIFSILGAFLTFSLPNIPFPINIIIYTPFIVALVALVFIIALKLLPW